LECYRIIFDLLSHLNELATLAGVTPNAALGIFDFLRKESNRMKAIIIKKALSSDDTLFHSALYNWYIEHGWIDELLHVTLKMN
jgi:hypothetical protein